MNNTCHPQADSIFRARFNGKPNVMTPRIYARRMIAAGALAVELSNGDGFKYPEQMWGVTVLNAANPRDDTARALSQAFTSRGDAECYIESLRAWRAAESQEV